jgi:hypothetical protein
MKTIFFIAVIIAIVVCCSKQKEQRSEFSQHSELRRFKCTDEKYKTTSGFWFIAIGSYSSEEGVKHFIKFYAKNKAEEYCQFEVRPHKVRVILNDTITKPFVIIHTDHYDYRNIYDCLHDFCYACNNTGYVTVACNPKDFPENLDFSNL